MKKCNLALFNSSFFYVRLVSEICISKIMVYLNHKEMFTRVIWYEVEISGSYSWQLFYGTCKAPKRWRNNS